MGGNTQTIGSSFGPGSTAQDNSSVAPITMIVPSLSNGLSFLTANQGITSSLTQLLSFTLPAIGRYFCFGQLTLSGATAAGSVAINLQSMSTQAMEIPDANVYSLHVASEYTTTVPNFVLRLQVQANATLVGASALRLDPITGAGATLLGYHRLA